MKCAETENIYMIYKYITSTWIVPAMNHDPGLNPDIDLSLWQARRKIEMKVAVGGGDWASGWRLSLGMT